MKLSIKTCILIAALSTLSALPAFADRAKPDDSVIFTLAAENWVSTKTARVTLGIEAAVSGNNAGSMRDTMAKAVGDIAKADWRLVSFSRGQDETGMERWSASYEARLPENELNGLNDAAKKVSKAGMQINVADMDFSPTLSETQATMAELRTQIYKQAVEQLDTLNKSIPGRNYRIASIDLTNGPSAMPMRAGRPMMMAMAKGGAEMDAAAPMPMERSEKITMVARVVLSTSDMTSPSVQLDEIKLPEKKTSEAKETLTKPDTKAETKKEEVKELEKLAPKTNFNKKSDAEKEEPVQEKAESNKSDDMDDDKDDDKGEEG